MLTSRKVRPGRVRSTVFFYHFTCGSFQWSSCCSDWGHFPSTKGTSFYATTTGSRTGVDLEVVFSVGPQSTLLKVHTRSLGSKTCAAMMKRCSSVDERPRCGYEVMTRILISMMTWCQDEVRLSRAEIMWVDHVSGHVSRSCKLIKWVVTCRDHVIGRSRDHDITRSASSNQLINYHYYLKRKGMLSVNWWYSGLVICRLTIGTSGIDWR